jgi:hypothetical protein
MVTSGRRYASTSVISCRRMMSGPPTCRFRADSPNTTCRCGIWLPPMATESRDCSQPANPSCRQQKSPPSQARLIHADDQRLTEEHGLAGKADGVKTRRSSYSRAGGGRAHI